MLNMKTLGLSLVLAIASSCLGVEQEPPGTSGNHKPEPEYDGRSLSYWLAQSKEKGESSRRAAAHALGQIGPEAKAAVPALMELLKDTDSELRWLAALALGQIGPEAKAAVPALMELLKDEEEKVYREAAEALGKIKSDWSWDVGRRIELIPLFRRPHMALVSTGRGREVPKIVSRPGSVVHRQMVEKLPSGLL